MDVLSRWYLLCLVTVFSFAAFGCDKKDSDSESSDPIVGVLELPVSLRTTDAAPDNPAKIEIGRSVLKLDGKSVVELTAGRLPEEDRRLGAAFSLEGALATGPARRAAVIRAHVNTPYETTVAVLRSLEKGHFSQVAFEVRKGGGAETGYLVPTGFSVISAEEAETPKAFAGGAQRDWDSFVQNWRAMTEACRGANSADCDFLPRSVASGGKVQIELWARGKGLKVVLQQFDAPETEEKAKTAQVEMIEGVPAAAGSDEAEEEEPEIADGGFSWRFEAATDEKSPISATLRPLCGAASCGAVVVAESLTPSMRLISFIGAAFPDGMPAPELRFVYPSR